MDSKKLDYGPKMIWRTVRFHLSGFYCIEGQRREDSSQHAATTPTQTEDKETTKLGRIACAPAHLVSSTSALKPSQGVAFGCYGYACGDDCPYACGYGYGYSYGIMVMLSSRRLARGSSKRSCFPAQDMGMSLDHDHLWILCQSKHSVPPCWSGNCLLQALSCDTFQTVTGLQYKSH